MFKKFIPALLAEKDMVAATATVATVATDRRLKGPLSQSSKLPSAPLPPQPCDNCDSRDNRKSVANVAVVARVRPEDLRPGPQIDVQPSPDLYGGDAAGPSRLDQRHQGHPWSARDWRAYFNERAGIAEYSGGLSRAAAEELAFEWCIVEWLNTSRVRSDPGRCAWCGAGSEEGHQLVPYGFGASQMWLHTRCHVHWYPARCSEALKELTSHGIERPASSNSRDQSARHLTMPGRCPRDCRPPDERTDQSGDNHDVVARVR